MPRFNPEGFIGQRHLVERIDRLLLLRGGGDFGLGHMLFQGENGSGRRSIARALAAALNLDFKVAQVGALQELSELEKLLESLPQRSLLCIANLDDLKPHLTERLASALRGGGPLMCIACASKKLNVPTRLRQVLPLEFLFEDYSAGELLEICRLNARKHELRLETADEHEILDHATSLQPGEIVSLLASLASLAGRSAGNDRLNEALITLGIRVPPSHTESDPAQLGGPDLYGRVQVMTGAEFEQFITTMLAELGFEAQTTQATADGGIDVVAHLDHPFVGGGFLVQCKRYLPGNNIGRPTLQEFCGAAHTDREHPRLIFVTTSSFTREARNYAKEVGIRLIDGEVLATILGHMHPEGTSVELNTISANIRGAIKFADGGNDISHRVNEALTKHFTSAMAAQTWALDNRENLYGVELWKISETEVLALFIPKTPKQLFQDY